MALGMLIVDARHKPTMDDCTMAQVFLNAGKPFIVVANKLDKLKKSEIADHSQLIRDTLKLPDSVPLILFSAEKGDGKGELLGQITNHLGDCI